MATYSPTLSTFTNGVVEIISLSSTTYEEILESLGSINYLLEMIYLYSQSIDQLTEPLQFVKYDANGNIAYKMTVPTLDPNQYQNSLYIKIDGKDYVFNGRTFVAFTINASQTLFMYFGTLSFGNKDFLPKEFLFESFTDRICQ